jgi:hypothetical protein
MHRKFKSDHLTEEPLGRSIYRWGNITNIDLTEIGVTTLAEFIWLRKEFCGYQPLKQLVAWSLLARVKFLASKIIAPQINP